MSRGPGVPVVERAPARPPVSVVVPFAGDVDDARATRDGLMRLSMRPGDEIIVSDNSADAVFEGAPPIRVVPARSERSSYFARNVGAAAAGNEWLLFMDADCVPEPEILDAYFEPVPSADCGIVAGGIVGAPQQGEWLGRWARSRRHLSEEHHMVTDGGPPHPAGITPNLMVRRETWESLGGFHEGIRSGGDVEICWRAQDAGWTLERRTEARVEHWHVTRLRRLFSQAARHNAGRLWVRRRYPGAFPRPRLVRPLLRSAVGFAVWTLTARFERGVFKLIDAVSISGSAWGWYAGSNIPERPGAVPSPPGEGSVVVVTDAFPARSETFVYNEVAGLIARGRPVRVESSVRPAKVERAVARELDITYLEDDPPRRKLADLAWLCARHPIRCLRDRWDRRRWSREEESWGLGAIAPMARRIARRRETHIHAHFAARAALHAMRTARLLGVPYSLTAHAYDLFQEPRNLPEKLEGAAFATGECGYTVDHMRTLVSPTARQRIHRVATGVDPQRFRRSKPYPGGGRVVAVGRLVEKKGFANLVRAAAVLRGNPALDEVEIAGEGPLKPEVERLIQELGVADLVKLRGNVWGAEAVASFLEDADVLVIPAVLASDGDRDALPVISYEALAMEVPVIASDLVGIPEVVRPPWGRLVAPDDVQALADAIGEVLERPAAERAEMGRAGRGWVMEHGDTATQVALLDELLSAGAAGPSSDDRFAALASSPTRG